MNSHPPPFTKVTPFEKSWICLCFPLSRVLSGFVDLVLARVYGQDGLDELAREATIPIIRYKLKKKTLSCSR